MEFSIEQALKLGVNFHNQGNLEEAERIYRLILQAKPQEPDANHNLGLIGISKNQTEAAIPLFRKAVNANPKLVQFWISYIEALVKSNQIDEAAKACREAINSGLTNEKLRNVSTQIENSLKTNDKSKYKKRGTTQQGPSNDKLNNLIALFQAGQIDKAETMAKSLTHEFPAHQTGWKALGVIFQQSGRMHQALEANKISVKLKPKDPEAHNNLGVVFKELNRLKESERSFRKAIALENKYAQAYSNLAGVLHDLGKLHKAQTIANRAINLEPDNGEAYFNLGNIFKGLNKHEKAEASYKKAISVNLDTYPVNYNLGNTLKALEKFKEAEKYYYTAIKLQPSLPYAYHNIGLNFMEQRKMGEAEMEVKKAINLKPDYSEAHYSLGVIMQTQGKIEDAVISFNKAISLNPKYTAAVHDLGTALQALGHLSDAQSYFLQTIKLDPRFPRAYCNLGINHYGLGNIPEALENLEKAVALSPKDSNFKMILTILRARQSKHPFCGPYSKTLALSSKKENFSPPLILHREVNEGLITTIMEMQTRRNDNARNTPVYGNGRCSLGYQTFEEDCPSIIKLLEADLTKIMESAVSSKIYVQDSFFNIFGAGSGIAPHTHLNSQDKEEILSLWTQKYSLVYYLDVGDQNCSEPGILELCDPKEEILPIPGMIVIFPAGRRHSAVYGGAKDRIMVGINFYSL